MQKTNKGGQKLLRFAQLGCNRDNKSDAKVIDSNLRVVIFDELSDECIISKEVFLNT